MSKSNLHALSQPEMTITYALLLGCLMGKCLGQNLDF